MAVVMETTLGDLTVDLFVEQRPQACLNFLKLCKMKYYNFSLFHSIHSGFLAQAGDPTAAGSGGESIWGLLEGKHKRYFTAERVPKIRHSDAGMLSMVCADDSLVGSQFFFTLGANLDSLDSMHCVIGIVTEGHDVLRQLNEVICDETHRPYRDVRVTHTVVLEDPFDDPPGLYAPDRSPSPSADRLKGGRIAPDEEIDETQGKTIEEINELIERKEAKARATILEIVGDLPDADVAPPENVLFVCKLNPVTTDSDLEIIFSRFGKIVNCEVIRDKKSGDSLQYAFIEFEDQKSCENAYFKMDNVLIDDRRIHVDFSQSVSKIKWLGKGRGVKHVNEKELDAKKAEDQPRKRSRSRERENRSGRRSTSRNRDDRKRRRSKSRDREDRSRKRSESRDRDRLSRTERENRKRDRDKDRGIRRNRKSKSRSPISRKASYVESNKYSRDSSRNQDRRYKMRASSADREKDSSRNEKVLSESQITDRDHSEEKNMNKTGDSLYKISDSIQEKKDSRKSEMNSSIDKNIPQGSKKNVSSRKQSGSLEQPATELDQSFQSRRVDRANFIKDEADVKGNTSKNSNNRLSCTKNMQDDDDNEEDNERRNLKESFDSGLLSNDKKSFHHHDDRSIQGEVSTRENIIREHGRKHKKSSVNKDDIKQLLVRNEENCLDQSRRDDVPLHSPSMCVNITVKDKSFSQKYKDPSDTSDVVKGQKRSLLSKTELDPNRHMPEERLKEGKKSDLQKRQRDSLDVSKGEKESSLSRKEREYARDIHQKSLRAENDSADQNKKECLLSKKENNHEMREGNFRRENIQSDQPRMRKRSEVSDKEIKSLPPRSERNYSFDYDRNDAQSTSNTGFDKAGGQKIISGPSRKQSNTVLNQNDEMLSKEESNRSIRERESFAQSERSIQPTKDIRDSRDTRDSNRLSDHLMKQRDWYDRSKGERESGENRRTENLDYRRQDHNMAVHNQRNKVSYSSKREEQAMDKKEKDHRRVPLESSRREMENVNNPIRDRSDRDSQFFEHPKRGKNSDRSRGTSEHSRKGIEYLEESKVERSSSEHSRRDSEYLTQSRDEADIVDRPNRELEFLENARGERFVRSRWDTDYLEDTRRIEPSRRDLAYSDNTIEEKVPVPHSRWDSDYLDDSRDQIEIIEHPGQRLEYLQNSREARIPTERRRRDLEFIENERAPEDHRHLKYFEHPREEEIEHSRRDLEYSNNLRKRSSVEYPRRDLGYVENPRRETEPIGCSRGDLEYVEDSRREIIPPDHSLINIERFEVSRGGNEFVEQHMVPNETIERSSRHNEMSDQPRPERIHQEYPIREMEYFDNSRMEKMPFSDRVRHQTEHSIRSVDHNKIDRTAQHHARHEMEYFEKRTDNKPTNSHNRQTRKDKHISVDLKRDKSSEQHKIERENMESRKNKIKLEGNHNKALLQSSKREKEYFQHSKLESLDNHKGDVDFKSKSRMGDMFVKTGAVKQGAIEPSSKQTARGSGHSSKDKIRNISTESEPTKTFHVDRSSDPNFNNRVKQAEPGKKQALPQSKEAHSENSTKISEQSAIKTEFKKSKQSSVKARVKDDSKAKINKLRQKKTKVSKKLSKVKSNKVKKLAKKKKQMIKKKGKESSSSSSDSSNVSSSSSTDSSSSESDEKKKSMKRRHRKRKVSTSSSSSSDTSSSSTSDTDSSSESSSSSSSSDSESLKRQKKKNIPDKKKVTAKIKKKE